MFDPSTVDLGKQIEATQTALNFVWVLLCAFLDVPEMGVQGYAAEPGALAQPPAPLDDAPTPALVPEVAQ